MDVMSQTGTLYIVGTPIGNLGDLSDRMRQTLADVDLIAAEDTRRTRQLLNVLDVKQNLISCHDHNEAQRVGPILERLADGEDVALVSDAGMPGISDPGAHLVAQVVEAGYPVVPIPGPCAFVSALCASGLPTDRFLFLGFLPHKAGKRQRALEAVAGEAGTLIFYEAPTRILGLLKAIEQVFPQRRVVLGRELTKKFETFERGTARSLLDYYDGPGASTLKGEFTVLIEGAGQKSTAPMPSLDGLDGAKGLKELSKHIARVMGIQKKQAYQALLQLKNDAAEGD